MPGYCDVRPWRDGCELARPDVRCSRGSINARGQSVGLRGGVRCHDGGNAAVAMACILERSNFINSAGGYLRDLTKRAELGQFSLGPMLMALLKANGEGALRAD